MIRMNYARLALCDAHIDFESIHQIQSDIKKYRMTYEQAGHIFRALQFIPAALALVSLSEVDEMRLIPPDKNMRFDEWLSYNAEKLQLFDEEPAMQIKYENPTYTISIYRDQL